MDTHHYAKFKHSEQKTSYLSFFCMSVVAVDNKQTWPFKNFIAIFQSSYFRNLNYSPKPKSTFDFTFCSYKFFGSYSEKNRATKHKQALIFCKHSSKNALKFQTLSYALIWTLRKMMCLSPFVSLENHT